MPVPRETIDALETVLSLHFSNVRHRHRAAFILCDELAEMACKRRAQQINPAFNLKCLFHEALAGVALDPQTDALAAQINSNHLNRNVMQHQSGAATVDEQHCADAILDLCDLINRLWPSTCPQQLHPWMQCGLRLVRLYSSQGDATKHIPFETMMRDAQWRPGAAKPPRVNQIVIEPGHRPHWAVVLTSSYDAVDAILTQLAIP